MAKLSTVTKLLDRLDGADMHYTLQSVRENSILVGVTVPGERWEIEFMGDGDIEIEVFKGDGKIYDYAIIEELFESRSED